MIILIGVSRYFVNLDPAHHATLGGALCIGVGLCLVQDVVVYEREALSVGIELLTVSLTSNASSGLAGPIRPAKIQYVNLPCSS